MSSSLTPKGKSDSTFVCDGEAQVRQACKGLPFYKKHNGKRYCVLHFPATNKNPAFDIAVRKKLESKDFNFERVWFPDVRWFSNLEINEPVNFRYAVFNDSAFFYETAFRADVNFEGATFNENTRFERATFAKKVDFSSARFQKDANFRNALFKGYANFWRCTFTGRAEFDYAEFFQTASFWPTIFESTASFSNARFVRANFGASEFKARAEFSWCVCGFAEFVGAFFNNDADFFSAKFNGMVNFAGAKFETSAQFRFSEFNGEARFTSASFNGKTDFSHTVFKDIVGFSAEYGVGGFGGNAVCDFRHARFEKPSRVSFHSVMLRPHWFVNLEPSPREFQFIDVEWIGNLKSKFINIEIGELTTREELEEKEAANRRAERLRSAEQYDDKFEIERLKREESEADANGTETKQNRFYRLLSIACRQFAVNAEENHRYEEASKFRYWAMDTRRLEKWRGFTFWRLSWWYWLASGYGERIFRAFVMLFGIWLLAAALYTQVGFARWEPRVTTEKEAAEARRDEVGEPLRWPRALTYSLGVMTLQKPEPRPATNVAQSLVMLETILGPVQAALLALAIRRKFMR